MKVLIIGSGGREHALAWKLKQSPRVTRIYAAPGNGGTAEFCQNIPIDAEDIRGLAEFAVAEGIDFAVAGPDDSLAKGVVDALTAEGIMTFGPTAAATMLEASKTFAKDFMVRHGIPTAKAESFDDAEAAKAYCRQQNYPLVIKADGLAQGKGVIIAQSEKEALAAIAESMESERFGKAGRRLLIEEFMQGTECSMHALIDGSTYLMFPDSMDHKQVFDGGKGPNTGGMGAVSPSGIVDQALEKRIREEIMDRFLKAIREDGIPFRGLIYPGLMITAEGPKVVEFNARFGDPETQPLLMRLKCDLLELLEATVEGKLAELTPEWDERAAVCVVLASGGYPGKYEKGKPITGIPDAEQTGAVVFHAGTKREADQVLTNGGRVLGVTALGEGIEGARSAAYAAVERIAFENSHSRKDIGSIT